MNAVAERPALIATGTRVKCTDAGSGTVFKGTIEEAIAASAVCQVPTYCVKRDEPIRVFGFIRTNYWAAANDVVELGVDDFDYERFEAQR